MDIEYAHVFAPNAAIILVEACSNSWTDLLYAEQVAFNYIVTHYPAGGQVSNSWQGGEFSGQIADDTLFADFTYNCGDELLHSDSGIRFFWRRRIRRRISEHQSVGDFFRRYNHSAEFIHAEGFV